MLMVIYDSFASHVLFGKQCKCPAKIHNGSSCMMLFIIWLLNKGFYIRLTYLDTHLFKEKYTRRCKCNSINVYIYMILPVTFFKNIWPWYAFNVQYSNEFWFYIYGLMIM